MFTAGTIWVLTHGHMLIDHLADVGVSQKVGDQILQLRWFPLELSWQNHRASGPIPMRHPPFGSESKPVLKF